jgi:DNA-binding response OmpR family regulator
MSGVARPRVLLADDDPRVLHVVARYLELEGFDMSTVEDGEAAVAAAAANPPDLIILDIMMPGIDGIEACRRIRANPETAETPVLMFSALSEEAHAAAEAGADGMLPKPFSLPSLAEAVRSFFAQHGMPQAS